MTVIIHDHQVVESQCSKVLDGVLLLFFFPEGEILLKEFNDGFGISESFLINIVDFLEGIRQSSFSKFASLLMVVHNFVMEDREVKGKTKSDWVAGVKGLRGSLGQLIVLKSTGLDSFDFIGIGALGNVSVVISHHLVEESFGLIGGGNSHA